MRCQTQVAISQWVHTAVLDPLQGQKCTGGFCHLFTLHEQEVGVQPEAGKWLASYCFGLCDFIGMVDWNMIDAASMDVNRFSEEMHSHRTALDVPARESNAPRRFPFHVSL